MKFYPIALFSLFVFTAGAAFGSNGNATAHIFKTNFFLENKEGLIPDYKGEQTRFFADNEGTGFMFTDHGLVYKLRARDEASFDKDHEKKNEAEEEEEKGMLTKTKFVFMHWLGANPHPEITGSEKSSGYYTFITGSNQNEWHTVITGGYSKITYHDLYPGIDVEYSFPEKGGIKYSLIVKPGADLSRVKMEYTGDVTRINTDKQGDLIFKTGAGNILEHAPVSFTNDNQSVASAFSIHNKTISFKTPSGFDGRKTLIVDPWVQPLTTLLNHEFGSYVDYDAAGNLYVYGAGSSTIYDTSQYQKVAMYNTTGAIQWTFMGVVAGVWSTNGYGVGGSWNNCLSSAKVDKSTGKIYVGQGFSESGAQAIRLTPAGVYDNFVTVADSTFREIWSFSTNCATGQVVALGGGPTTNYSSIGIVNTTTGVLSINNITGTTAYPAQDVVSGALDPNGNLFVYISGQPGSGIYNHLYRVNSTLNGNTWGVASGHHSFVEHISMPAFAPFGSSSNFNALAVNSNYLFYFDGKYLMAFNPTTGAQAGTTYTVPGYDTLLQGGIAVDKCNNVYCGGAGVIKTFTFNGSTFTPQADISLGTGFTTDTLFDVRYNPTNHLLYVSGSKIVGTYTASLSTTCLDTLPSFTTSINDTCNQAIVQVTGFTGVSSPAFSYTWLDSTGTIVRQTSASTTLTDTLNNPSPGHYTVQVMLNVNCTLYADTDSFSISPCSVTATTLTHSNDTSICSGQPVTLTANGLPAGGSYLWQPGGAISSSINVTPASTTTYYVTYTPLTGSAITDSIAVTVSHAATVSVNDTTICRGQNAMLTAQPSVGGGTYLWSPGAATTQSITVSPLTNAEYTVLYTSGTCGAATDSGLVTVVQPPVLSVTANDTTVCSGQPVGLTASATGPGGTFLWNPGSFTSASIQVTPTATTVYTVSYQSICPSVFANDTVNVTPLPTVSVPDTTICAKDTVIITASASPGGGTFVWTPGGATTSSITVTPAVTTSYSVAYATAACPSSIAYDTAVVTVHAAFQALVKADTTTICSNDTAHICTDSAYAAYLWNTGGTTQCIYTSSAGNYYVTVTNVYGCTAESNHLGITVREVPPVSISVSQDTLKVNNGLTFQWYFNGSILPGDTSAILIARMPGEYSVEITDTSGCSSTSNQVVISGIDKITSNQFDVYPNPAGSGGWNIAVSQNLIGQLMRLYDDEGRLVYKARITQVVSVIGSNLAAGAYLLQLNNGEAQQSIKLIKQ